MGNGEGLVKRNKTKLILVLIAVMVVVMSACSKQEDKKKQDTPVKIALTQDMLDFDPMLTSDIYSEAVLRSVYTSLYDLDNNLTLRPKLAKSSKVIDNLTWQIEIHDNVKWQDGSTLTTDDVVFSIERAMKGGRTQKLLEMVDRVEKIDDTNFRIIAKEPYTDLLTVLLSQRPPLCVKRWWRPLDIVLQILLVLVHLS